MEEKKYFVSVRSYVENLDDFGLTESTESEVTTFPCDYVSSGGVSHIGYEGESDKVKVKTEITAERDYVRLSRTGGIESVMEFSAGKITKTLYRVPPYAFDAEIDTKKIRDSLDACGGTLELLYYLTIGGAKKKMRLSLTVGVTA